MVLMLFWVSLTLLGYIYLGFPCLIMLRGVLNPKAFQTGPLTPSVSVLIAAHNEESCIRNRIENLRRLDYPAEHLEIIVASDGSSDRTNAIVSELLDPNLKLLELPRIGKGAALNAAAEVACGEVLVFSDANSHFESEALWQLVLPFADLQVGGVAGNQVYTANVQHGSAADGERIYWSFDRLLKLSQSVAGNVTSATGAIYAIRRDLFQAIPAHVMDDFVISTQVVAQGRRLVFAPQAIAREPVAGDSTAEYFRKVRVAHQGLAAVWYMRRLLNPFRHGWYSWQLFSHKVLRRLAIVPMVLLLISSGLLVSEGLYFRVAFCAELLIGLLAAVPLVFASSNLASSKVFAIPHYFFLVNIAAGVAWWRLLCGRRIDQWQSERHQAASSITHSSSSTSSC